MIQNNIPQICFKQKIRPLHWVIKVSDLKQSIKLLTLLGCRVLRQESFSSGCEAECNGKYSGAWIKTMIGFDSEDNSFVFELTYNYGVRSYKRGNDLKYIALYKYNNIGQDMEQKLIENYNISANSDGIYSLINQDFQFKFIDQKAQSPQLILAIRLTTINLEKTIQYWQHIGLYSLSNSANILIFQDFDYLQLQFEQVDYIDKGEAYGRLAISCADEDVYNVFKQSNSQILTEPIVLKTEGKADVIVTILLSPDGQEICFVNDIGFRELSKETGLN